MTRRDPTVPPTGAGVTARPGGRGAGLPIRKGPADRSGQFARGGRLVFLAKPFSADALRAKVREVLDGE